MFLKLLNFSLLTVAVVGNTVHHLGQNKVLDIVTCLASGDCLESRPTGGSSQFWPYPIGLHVTGLSSLLSFDDDDESMLTMQNDGCRLIVPSDTSFSPSIRTGDNSERELPLVKNNGKWYIKLKQNDTIRATCGGGGKPFIEYNPYLTCVRETKFRDGHNRTLLLPDGIECLNVNKPTTVLYRNGTCFGNNTNFLVEFVTGIPPAHKFYTVCMDEDSSAALYSSSYIDGESFANGRDEKAKRPSDFRGQEFYPFAVKQAYNWDYSVEDRLTELLGSKTLVKRYFPAKEYRFSRGHLFPNADGVKRFEKFATFYFINVVPQWQVLNGGNWERLEHDVRDLAKSLKRKLLVTTGAYGVTTLKDVNNNDVELWLARDDNGKNRLPVPRFVWKVVHDPVGSAAVAIVQVNNPWNVNLGDRESSYGSGTFSSDILCKNLGCSSLKWLRAKEFHTLKKGYTYCCDVQELRESIPYVPNIRYSKILGADSHPRSHVFDSSRESAEEIKEENEEDRDSGFESDDDDNESIFDFTSDRRSNSIY